MAGSVFQALQERVDRPEKMDSVQPETHSVLGRLGRVLKRKRAPRECQRKR